MRIKSNQNARSTGSRFRPLIGLGAASLIVVAGVALISAVPASAAATLTFGSVPTSGQVAGTPLSQFTVTESGGTSTDTINITSSCNPTGNLQAAAGSGVATFSDVILDGAGSACTLVATDATSGGSASTTVPVSPATPSKLVFSTEPPADATFAVAIPFTVSVEDQYGNVETGTNAGNADSITISSSCASPGGTLTQSATGGVDSFSTVTIPSPETPCTFTATDNTHTLPTVTSSSVTLSSNTPTQVAFTTQPSGPVAAGTVLPTFAVSVEQSNGVVVSASTGDNDVITLTSACKLAGATSATAAAGVATFSDVIIDSSGSCVLTATDSSRTLATANSSAVSITAGLPTHLAFVTAPEATVNGTGVTLPAFVVAVEDAFNNIVTTGTGASDSIVLSSACGLSGTTTEPAVAGDATFTNIAFSGTGSCTITATDLSRTLTAATATTSVGEPQAALTLTSTGGYLDAPLTLVTKGGSGSGAVTYTVTNGTATGCTITSGTLRATTSGTCIVTATKAAASPYAAISTAATTVTISSAPLAQHLVGKVTIGHTSVVTISGYNFSGRPTAKSNVAGFTALVTKDTGRVLTVRITVKASSTKPGVKVMTLTFSNGKRTSFKYSLH